jgi:hypothetical protein
MQAQVTYNFGDFDTNNMNEELERAANQRQFDKGTLAIKYAFQWLEKNQKI